MTIKKLLLLTVGCVTCAVVLSLLCKLYVDHESKEMRGFFAVECTRGRKGYLCWNRELLYLIKSLMRNRKH